MNNPTTPNVNMLGVFSGGSTYNMIIMMIFGSVITSLSSLLSDILKNIAPWMKTIFNKISKFIIKKKYC